MKKFSEILKALRISEGLSQSQLSRETGLSQSAINYWESERRVPNAYAIVVLAEYFGVTTDYLLGLE